MLRNLLAGVIAGKGLMEKGYGGNEALYQYLSYDLEDFLAELNLAAEYDNIQKLYY